MPQPDLSEPLPLAAGQEPISLLVSVRDSSEVDAALSGGADILDIKAPDHGSLGMPSVETLRGVFLTFERTVADSTAPRVPLSIALGEPADWPSGSAMDFPEFPAGTCYFKLGSAGLTSGPTPWQSSYFAAWKAVFSTTPNHWVFQKTSRNPPPSTRSQSLFYPIAVAYADHLQASSPSPEHMLEFAIREHFHGLLIDTSVKTAGGSLFDHVDVSQLRVLCKRARAAGVVLALAGQLSRQHIPALREIAPDYVGIRSAACPHGRRTGHVDAHLIAGFRRQLGATSDHAAIRPCAVPG